jgi:hypothetical protein
MPDSEKPSTYAERLAALNLLRENLFYANPGRYSASDVAEDLPGSARTLAPIVKNVLPSASIISSDPEERKKQIIEALKRIKRSGGAHSSLGKEILNNVTSMGGGALTAGFILSSAVRLLGWKGLTKLDATGKKVFQNPFQLGRNLDRLSARKNYANALLRRSGYDALTGAGLAAAAGTAYPLYEHYNPSKNQALIEAADIIQRQPYLTSIPGSEMVSALRADDEDSALMTKLKNTGVGSLLGGAAGVFTATHPPIITALGRSIGNAARYAKGKPLLTVTPRLINELGHELPKALAWGAGIGGVAGALTDRMPRDERKKISPNTP